MKQEIFDDGGRQLTRIETLISAEELFELMPQAVFEKVILLQAKEISNHPAVRKAILESLDPRRLAERISERVAKDFSEHILELVLPAIKSNLKKL